MEMKSVSSSNISSIGYDVESKTLEITFWSGATYRYTDVPEQVFEDLTNADSVGRFFASNIKGSYAFEKV